SFVEEGFATIWDYLRRVHKQSDTMIHYRVSCARAVNRFPQVVEYLGDGRLCMTTLAKLMEVMNEANCDALLAEALGKSKRDAEKIVAGEKPKPVPKDVMRRVDSTFPGKSVQPIDSTFPGKSEPPAMPVAATEQRVQALTGSLTRVYMTVNQDYIELLKEM